MGGTLTIRMLYGNITGTALPTSTLTLIMLAFGFILAAIAIRGKKPIITILMAALAIPGFLAEIGILENKAGSIKAPVGEALSQKVQK